MNAIAPGRITTLTQRDPPVPVLRTLDSDPLLSRVNQAIDNLTAHTPAADPERPAPGQPPVSPRFLLTLLCYCYASGIYDSQDIEDRLTTDPRFIALGAGRWVDAASLRRFRRGNQHLILNCLAHVLRGAHRPAALTQGPPMVRGIYAEDALDRWTAGHPGLDRTITDARCRVRNAILADAMALDE